MPNKKPDGLSKAMQEFLEFRNSADIAPAVELLVEDGMSRQYAEDVVNGYIQFYISHKHSPDPRLPYVLLRGPITTLHQKLVTESLDLEQRQVDIKNQTRPIHVIQALTDQMLCRLQMDYGKFLARSLQRWVFRRSLVDHAPVALVWSLSECVTIAQNQPDLTETA